MRNNPLPAALLTKVSEGKERKGKWPEPISNASTIGLHRSYLQAGKGRTGKLHPQTLLRKIASADYPVGL